MSSRNRNKSSDQTKGTTTVSDSNKDQATQVVAEETLNSAAAGADEGAIQEADTIQDTDTGATEGEAGEGQEQAAPEATQVPEAIQAPAATDAPVVTQAPEPEVTAAPIQAVQVATYTDDAAGRLQERLDTTLTKTEAIIRDTLATYLEELKPGRPASPATVNSNQVSLWRLFLRVVEAADDTEFEKGYTLLVAYFRAHRKGALGEYYVFRGMENITLDSDTTAAFHRALNLLIIGATTVNLKETGRHADLARSLPEGIYSDNARNRLLGFLS